MARLPSKNDLSGPASLRSGRAIATFDATAIGRGISSAAGSIASYATQVRQQEATVDIARAEALKTEGNLAVENEFEQDPDYVTFDKRAPARTNEIIQRSAALIRDPQMRERWILDARRDAAVLNDRIADKGRGIAKQAEQVAFDDGLETNRRLYVDPKTPDDVKDKARADIAASIDMGEASGLFTPEQAAARRENFLDNADYNRALLAVEQDPSIVSSKLPEKVADRSAAAIRYYQSRGWSKEQAAGIVGNLLGESTLNTGARNPGDGRDGSDSIGIGQWNGDRAAALKKFAAGAGKDWTDFDVQLAFVDHELRTSEKSAGDALRNAATIDDATAAFVGYERPAGWSAANPRGAHNYKGRLKFAAQAAGEKIDPEWMDRLSPEKRQIVYDKAAQKQKQDETANAAQRKAAYESYKDSYGLQILTGGIASEQQILTDPLLNDGDKATFLRSFRTEMKDALATAEAVQAFASGNLRVDPYDTDGRNTVDKVYDATVKAAPENVQPITEEIVRQTGVVPKAALSVIRQGMTSTDASAVTAAAQAAQRLSTINPAALSRRDGGSDVQKMADDFTYYVNTLGMDAATAAERIRDAQDPARIRERKVLEPAAKEYLKTLDTQDYGAMFDETWAPFDTPDVGFNDAQRLGIAAEFKAIAEQQFYQTNGNPQLATNRAVNEMKRLYGVTEMSGRKVVMKHPPERYWPPEPGAADPFAYARDQIADEFSQFITDEEVAASLPAFTMSGGNPQETIKAAKKQRVLDSLMIVPTPKTDAMVKAGELPGYFVGYVDDNGNIQTIPGKLFVPDTSVLKRAAETVRGNVQRELDWARQDDAERRALQDSPDGGREQSLDQFLGGP